MPIFDAFFGPPNIDKLKQRGDLNGLLKALGYSRGGASEARRVRAQAQAAIVSMGEAAIQPLAALYLYERKVEPKRVFDTLVEIGIRAADPNVPLKVVEKLFDLLDLRPDHRRAVLRAIYRLTCRASLPTVCGAVLAQIEPWLHVEQLPIRAEAALCLILASAQINDYKTIYPWLEKLTAWVMDSAELAVPVATALGEAAPCLSDPFLQGKCVQVLFQILERYSDHPKLPEAVGAALKGYGLKAAPPLLARIEADPKDRFAYDALFAVGKSIRGGGAGDEQAFQQLLIQHFRHPNWDVRFAIAEILQAGGWNPRDETSRADLLLALRAFNPPAWAAIPLTSSLVEQLTALLDDASYPARYDLVMLIASLPNRSPDMETRARIRGALVRALRGSTISTRPYIVRSLNALGWLPENNALGALYWAYKEDWQNAAAIGEPAIETLIECLAAPEMPVRRAAALALVALYRSPQASSAAHQRILSVRSQVLALAGEPMLAAKDQPPENIDQIDQDQYY